MARASHGSSSRARMPRSTRPSGRARTRSSALGSLWGMGLLDDAIREHLELKRSHGADPGEIAQLEREAFGPARRGPEPLEVPGGGRGPSAPPGRAPEPREAPASAAADADGDGDAAAAAAAAAAVPPLE